MAGLKELRTRLETAKSTQQLTAAMKMVSVSKLRKAQDRASRIREMCFRLMDVYRETTKGNEEYVQSHLLHKGYGNPSRVLVVVLSSDKGMCGTFNSAVCKAAEEHIRDSYGGMPLSDVGVCCIGGKAGSYFSDRGYAHFLSRDCVPASEMDYGHLSAWMEEVLEAYSSGRIHQVDVVSCRPVNAATQEIRVQKLLPVSGVLERGGRALEDYLRRGESAAWIDHVRKARQRAAFFRPGQMYVLPGEEAVLESMLPKVAVLYLYFSLCQSFVAEHGARMTAMSQATDNAEELIKDLNLKYNKLRQSGITNELIEIVSGATAQE